MASTVSKPDSMMDGNHNPNDDDHQSEDDQPGCLCCIRSSNISTSASNNQSLRQRSDIIRLIMVGNGEVGKSTIIKQLQNLALMNSDFVVYDETWRNVVRPFTLEERRDRTLLVHQNIMRIIGTLIQKVRDYNYHFDSPANESDANRLLQSIGSVDTVHNRQIGLSPETADVIDRLWQDRAIQRAYNKRCEYLLSDSTKYFLDRRNLTTFCQPNYVPTMDDILRARDPTQGPRDYNFRIRGNRFSLRDLGGQPVELSHLPRYLADWLKECETSRKHFILFVASLADYNQRVAKHPQNTQLDESIQVLKILMDIRDLRQTGFILFLNKTDVFREKLMQYNDLQEYFQEYMNTRYLRRPPRAIDNRYLQHAEQCVASKFHDAILGTIRRDDALYCRFTNATDRDGMQAIISAVRMDILTDLIRRGTYPP